MKVLLLYRPDSEHARMIEEFMREFTRVYTDHTITLVNIDTREGAATATLYDIMSYPAVLALGNDGLLINHWQGERLPLMSEVAYYANA